MGGRGDLGRVSVSLWECVTVQGMRGCLGRRESPGRYPSPDEEWQPVPHLWDVPSRVGETVSPLLLQVSHTYLSPSPGLSGIPACL